MRASALYLGLNLLRIEAAAAAGMHQNEAENFPYGTQVLKRTVSRTL